MRVHEPSKLTVVHVLAPARFGGLEGVVLALATGHAARGYDVHVVAVLDRPASDEPLLGRLESGGVNVLPVSLPTRAYLRERACVRDLCKRVRPDVVHIHGYRPDVLDAGVGRCSNAATVTTIHGYTGGGWKNRFYERLQRFALHRFDGVVAVSRPLLDSLRRRGIAQDRSYLVPNAWAGGVDHIARDLGASSTYLMEHFIWAGSVA